MWDDARQLNAIAATLAVIAIAFLSWALVGWVTRLPAFAFREVVVTTPLVRASGAHLEAVIRGDRAQQPLVDSAAYRQITKDFPQKTSILSFQQTDDQLKVIYEALRQGQLQNADLPQEAKDVLAKLPEFEAMKKYLPVGGGYTVPDENGALFISISQMKEK